MKVWITKYALTKGIIEAEDAEVYSDAEIKVTSFGHYAYFCRDEWHLSLESAQSKVRKMIAAKRKSYAKKLAKLDKLEKELTKGQNT